MARQEAVSVWSRLATGVGACGLGVRERAQQSEVCIVGGRGLAEPILLQGAENNACEFWFEGRSFTLDY